MTKQTKSIEIIGIFLLFLASFLPVGADPIDDFLSSTLLGQKTDSIEKKCNLVPGSLKGVESYVEIDQVIYKKCKFIKNVFFRENECRAYGLWVNQIRIMDKAGRPKIRYDTNVYDVFLTLHDKLRFRFQDAPKVKIESGCCGCDDGELSQTYTWVNRSYALILAFHDNVTSQSITLRQYRRDEKNGEYFGEERIAFLEDLYNNRSGELPDDWPNRETTDDVEGSHSLKSNDKIENGRAAKSARKKKVAPERGSEHKKHSLLWIVFGVLLLVLLALGVKFANYKHK
ncbi:MAG: hypothetical protein KDN05_02615 [Verrucomicrobiae bacterium]|nr:hypothetical protein [Verrucomicrobiae bacterium]MCP5531608.1 hypothetical protein [Akkermansiaceae bacterium]MCP5542804.1 hypothetical protein [Akkermansiaceae bacterium]MCP5547138.1 hypothetical protein [Akkermansiaceae bacterium]